MRRLLLLVLVVIAPAACSDATTGDPQLDFAIRFIAAAARAETPDASAADAGGD
ncbi:MAG TPA: hypothetical protein VIF62_09525 [Labilithrix sp.]